MLKSNIIIAFTALSFLFNGCTEEIELTLKSSTVKLVVDGVVTTDTTAHTVRLTYTADYFSNEPAKSVSNAKVFINDGESTIELLESVKMKGTYLTPDTYFGIEGRTYKLTVNNVDIDNDGILEEYLAESIIEPVVKIDSVVVGYQADYELWQVLLFSKDPKDVENFYAFRVYNNDSLITDSYSKLTLADDAFFDGSDVNGVWVTALDANESGEDLEKGDVVTLEMASVSKPYYKFLVGAITEVTPKNPMFSGPPANVPSNISNGALGYFAAYSVDRANTVVKFNAEDFK